MALETETGTGSETAESFCSVADADAYHAARGYTLWATMSEVEREQTLRRATGYMQQTYRTRWAGCRVYSVQALDWPRYDVPRRDYGDYYPSDTVPREVRDACAELAFRASSGELAADLGQQVTERTVGPITTKYAAGSTSAKRYRAVDMLLGPLLRASGSGAVVGLVRS